LTLDTPVNFSLPVLTFTDLTNQTVEQQNLILNSTSDVTLNSTIAPQVNNTTLSSNCNRTRLLFSNMVESFETNRSPNRFHHDVDLFIGHLDNMTRFTTDKKHHSIFFMIRKLVTLLNGTVNENAVNVNVPAQVTTSAPTTTVSAVLNSVSNLENLIQSSSTVSPFLSISSVTGSPNNSDLSQANPLTSTRYNMLLKLIKYEYYRNLNHESDDDEDSDDEDDNGQFSYYKSMSQNRHYNYNNQMFY
jgi:hypothetical protein